MEFVCDNSIFIVTPTNDGTYKCQNKMTNFVLTDTNLVDLLEGTTPLNLPTNIQALHNLLQLLALIVWWWLCRSWTFQIRIQDVPQVLTLFCLVYPWWTILSNSVCLECKFVNLLVLALYVLLPKYITMLPILEGVSVLGLVMQWAAVSKYSLLIKEAPQI